MTTATGIGIGHSIVEGNDGSFTLTGGASIRGMDLNGVLTTNPTTLNNGSPYITPVHAIRNTNGPHQSIMGYLAEALIAEGMSAVDVMSAGFPSSPAADWEGSTSTSTLCGSSIAMTELLLLESGVNQDFFVLDYQGHADTINQADADAWLQRKRDQRAYWRTHFSKPNLLWVIGVLAPTNPTPGTRPYWQQLVDAGFTLANDDDDTLAVQAPDGPFIDGGVGTGGIHPTEAAQRVHTAAMARIIYARKAGVSQNLASQNIRGSNQRDADLRGSELENAGVPGADFKGAKLDGCDFTGVSLTACNLSGASVTGATFSGAVLPPKHLSGNSYAGANLIGAKVTGKTF